MEKLLKRKTFLFILLLIIPALMLGALSAYKVARAESTTAVELSKYLPESDMEQYDLSSPVDVCYWNDSVAIVHTNELVVYVDGEYKSPISLSSPQQVQKLSNDQLIVSHNGSLSSINLSDLTQSALQYEGGTEPVGCNYFDCNDNYIVTAFSKDILVYPHNGLSVSAPISFVGQIDIATPISINNKGEIFYIHNDQLLKCTVTDRTENLILNEKPTAILANDNFVYMIINGKIVRINTDGTNRIDYVVSDENKDFALGNLASPVSLSFKGDNLLIADSTKNAIQEFKLTEEGELEFTGFAIAKNKTAFNRIGTTAKKVDVNLNTTAILDEFKLTVITDTENGKTYKNFLTEDLGNINNFAISKKAIAYYTDGSFVKFVDLSSGEISSPVQIDGKITDISERNGKFYISIIKNENVSVLVSNGSDFSLVYTLEKAYDVINAPEKTPILTVDKDENVIVSHPVENKFYKIMPNLSASVLPVLTADGISKIQTDLAGDVFGLKQNVIVYTDGTSLFETQISSDDKITSFALGENKKSVFFTKLDVEGVLITNELPNFSVEDVVTTNYKTNGKNTDLSNFKSYMTKTPWILEVSVDSTENEFTFKQLDAHQSKDMEFLFICNAPITKTLGDYTKTINFTILAGQLNGAINSTFVEKTENLSETTSVTSANQEKAYVITDVNMYYLPVISIDNTYCLTDDNGTLRIKKGTEILPINRLTFLGKEFFFAELITEDGTISGFIPVNFTVEVLDKDVVQKTFTLEEVKAVTVKDENGNAKIDLAKGTTIRLYTIKDGTATIEYLDQGIWKHGYIESSAIIKTDNATIRNAIIIILMTASVIATSVFFITKKKKYN